EHREHGDRRHEDPAHLGEFLGIARGQEQLCHAPRASRWNSASDAHPATARSSSASSSSRRNGVPSAVPCTSTNDPSPVTTTFMSGSARTSSSYIRSRRARPPIPPTEPAEIELTNGSGRASEPFARN